MYFKRFYNEDAESSTTGGAAVAEAPESDGKLEAAEQRFNQYIDKNNGQPTTEEPSGEEQASIPSDSDDDVPAEEADAAPQQPSGLQKYREAQAEAKNRGLSAKGSLEELQQRIAEHDSQETPAETADDEAEWDDWMAQAKQRHRFTDADRERFESLDDLKRTIVNLDRQQVERELQKPPQRQPEPQQPPPQQQQQQWQPEPEPQQQPEGFQEPDWTALEEEFGEDNPLLVQLKQMHGMTAQAFNQSQQLQQQLQTQQQMAEQRQLAQWQDRCVSAIDSVVKDYQLENIFGTGTPNQRPADQFMNTDRVYRQVNQLVQLESFQNRPLEETVAFAIRDLYGESLAQKKGNRRAEAAKKGKARVLGAPASKREAPLPEASHAKPPHENENAKRAFLSANSRNRDE